MFSATQRIDSSRSKKIETTTTATTTTTTTTTKREEEEKREEEPIIKEELVKANIEGSDCDDRELKKMVAEADIVCTHHHHTIHMVDVPSYSTTPTDLHTLDHDSCNKSDVKPSEPISVGGVDTAVIQYLPTIRSGSFADIGPRRFMEDEHIRIDDLSSHLGSLCKCPTPSAFFGVFDGHGGPDAAAYMKENAIKIFFKDADFLQTIEADDVFLEAVENSLRSAFLFADLALADDCSVSSSCGTTALTALILGRLLLVANAGDCRAVLCRKGEALVMSQDHRPIYAPERSRVEKSGGYIDDGYLNGVLSVSRALGDWDMKLPQGSTSPLIAEPEFSQILLTEDDEFLIIGCDGIWDVMSSQQAVSLVRRGLRRHDNPDQCARDLAIEALRLNTSDNLTVIVVCFSPLDHRESSSRKQPKMRCFSLSAEALCSLRSLLDDKEPKI